MRIVRRLGVAKLSTLISASNSFEVRPNSPLMPSKIPLVNALDNVCSEVGGSSAVPSSTKKSSVAIIFSPVGQLMLQDEYFLLLVGSLVLHVMRNKLQPLHALMFLLSKYIADALLLRLLYGRQVS